MSAALAQASSAKKKTAAEKRSFKVCIAVILQKERMAAIGGHPHQA
jgi:hypothetical protein